MKIALDQIQKIQDLNISSIRGMLKILKPIKADEASAVRLMLAQLLTNENDAKKLTRKIQNKNSPSPGVDWSSVTEDLE